MAHEIEFSAFSFRYWKDSPPALMEINLRVPPSSICAVLGPTNSGKTTLIHAIAGILGSHHRESIASGSIRIGSEIYNPLPRKALFPEVGLTIQEPYFQISGLCDSVFEEVSLTLECLGVNPEDIRDRTNRLIDTLGLAHLASRKPSTLSGGELQKVALATILIARPPVLLLDEPCNSLDMSAQHRLASFVCSIKGTSTIFLADYQLELAMLTADQFVVLEGGKVVFSGDRNRFIENLPGFHSLLPVDEWDSAVQAVTAAQTRNRVSKLIG